MFFRLMLGLLPKLEHVYNHIVLEARTSPFGFDQSCYSIYDRVFSITLLVASPRLVCLFTPILVCAALLVSSAMGKIY